MAGCLNNGARTTDLHTALRTDRIVTSDEELIMIADTTQPCFDEEVACRIESEKKLPRDSLKARQCVAADDF